MAKNKDIIHCLFLNFAQFYFYLLAEALTEVVTDSLLTTLSEIYVCVHEAKPSNRDRLTMLNVLFI